MPCRDYQNYLNPAELAMQNLHTLLCSACRTLEHLGYDFAENPGLDEWWDKHKLEDLARREEEAKQKLIREQAVQVANKPFKDLTHDDKALLRKAGLL